MRVSAQLPCRPIVAASLAMLAAAGCDADEDPSSPDAGGVDVATLFAEKAEYQREAKVMSAPHQVYPEEICVDAKDSLSGEAFCFSNGMLGNVPEGENFLDHGDCTDVRTMGTSGHRPVLPPAEEDARHGDPKYLAEVDWVRSELETSGCTCCHNSEGGYATVFDFGLGNTWVSTMSNSGVALAAGLVGEGVFVAVPPGENLGYEQGGNAFVSNDPERLQQFFMAEVAYRELTDEHLTSAQLFYDSVPFASLKGEVPEPCPEGVGVEEDGTVHWTLEGARFLNILQDAEENPNIPPLDSPEGTFWRYEAVATADALEPASFGYGTDDSKERAQRFPRDGAAPAALVDGETYTLFVATRMSAAFRQNCTFTFPIDTP